jgi:hypothetical protein
MWWTCYVNLAGIIWVIGVVVFYFSTNEFRADSPDIY